MVSGGEQRDSTIIYMNPFSPKPPSHPVCHITWSSVPYAIQWVLVGYPFYFFLVIHFKYSTVYLSIPNSLVTSSPNLPPPTIIKLASFLQFSFSITTYTQSLFRPGKISTLFTKTYFHNKNAHPILVPCPHSLFPEQGPPRMIAAIPLWSRQNEWKDFTWTKFFMEHTWSIGHLRELH